MRIAAIIILVLLAASPAHGQRMPELARATAEETVRHVRSHNQPPSAPEPRIVMDLRSFQRAFGDAISPVQVLGGIVASYGHSPLSSAVECAPLGTEGRRSCALRNASFHLHVDSVTQNPGGYDVVVTATFTERRRVAALGFTRLRLSFAREGDAWVLIRKSIVGQS